MKPAELVTVITSIPLFAALLVTEAAKPAAPQSAPAQQTVKASAAAPVAVDEIVVIARRPTSKG